MLKSNFKKFLLKISIFFSLCFIYLLTSCGIEGFDTITLQVPLGVVAESGFTNTNGIRVSFWGLNDESYFEGYQILIYENPIDYSTNGGKPIPNKENYTNKPTIYNVQPFSEARKFSYLIEKKPDGSDFVISNTYFFSVKAYSLVNNFYSKPGNLAEVMYLTNIRITVITNTN